MAISSEWQASNNTLHIRIVGHFNFSMHREFTNTYKGLAPSSTCVVDLQRVEFMDSSSLGMLLQLCQHLGKDPHRIILKNANDNLLKVIKMAHIDRNFTIE